MFKRINGPSLDIQRSHRTCKSKSVIISHVVIHIPYGELESQTGGAPGRGIQGWEVRVEWSGCQRPAPPVTIRLGVMRLVVIILGVRPLDSGGGCIWVNSASSLESLLANKTRSEENIRSCIIFPVFVLFILHKDLSNSTCGIFDPISNDNQPV